jgi:hypothetical protein
MVHTTKDYNKMTQQYIYPTMQDLHDFAYHNPTIYNFLKLQANLKISTRSTLLGIIFQQAKELDEMRKLYTDVIATQTRTDIIR